MQMPGGQPGDQLLVLRGHRRLADLVAQAGQVAGQHDGQYRQQPGRHQRPGRYRRRASSRPARAALNGSTAAIWRVADSVSACVLST